MTRPSALPVYRINRDRDAVETQIGGLNENLTLENETVITGCIDIDHFQHCSGVEAEAGLRIPDWVTRGPRYPEVSEVIGKPPEQRGLIAVVQTRRYNDAVEILFMSGYQPGDLLWAVLKVAVQCYHEVTTKPKGLMKTPRQGCGLAVVSLV